MTSVSDIIEEFILTNLADSGELELSRNDLAKYFSCVPSQINYVLNTRFTINRGYIIESTRGGAGYVKVIKVNTRGKNYLEKLMDICDHPLNFNEGCQILSNLNQNKYISEKEFNLLKRAISTKSLNNPLNMENIIRTNILREVIIELMKK